MSAAPGRSQASSHRSPLGEGAPVPAAPQAHEPSAKYLSALQPKLVQHFDLLGTAPGGVAKLRELILTLAVRGKLVPQDSGDEPASELLKRIRAKKYRLVVEGKIKRGKPPTDIHQGEYPFSLPHGWEWVRLNSLLQKIGAGSTPLGGREVYVPNGMKFLRSQNVWNDGLHLDGVAFIKPETHARMNGTVVFANDLLFNITGASIGRCAVVPNDFDEANVSQHVTIIRTVMPELNEFLHKVLVSQHVQQTVMNVQVGVSREGLSIAKLGQFLIPVPPLAEQARIVIRVEELMRLCDALETQGQLEAAQHAQLVQTLLGALTASATQDELADNWQRVATHFDLLLDRPQAVDALEQTILQLAVRGLLVPQDPNDEPASVLLKKIRAEKDRLIAEGKIKRDKPLREIAADEQPTELPVGWEWVRLGSISEFTNGYAFPSSEFSSDATGVGVVKIGDIQNGTVSVANMSYVSQQYASSIDESFRVAPGDMLIAMSGATTGKLGFNKQIQTLLLNQRVGRIALYFVHQAFAHQYLTTKIGENLSISAGSAIPNLSTAQIKEIAFPLPPLAEQSRIVAHVESLRRLCADLRQRLTARQTTQAHLADALVATVST